jgi:hypothetical protein
MQQFRREVAVDLAPQARDEHVDDVGLGIEPVRPHVFQDHRLRDGAARAPHQEFQE